MPRFHHCDTWDDLRTPVTAINPPGGVSDPTRNTSTGLLEYGASGTELIYVVVQMPHSWKEGSIIRPHVHWHKTASAAGDVVWQLGYKKSPKGSVADAAYTNVTASTTTVETPDNDTAEEHLVTSFGDISTTGMKISDMFLIQLSRLGSDGSDTYGSDAALIEFDIHYQLDSTGSIQEFSK